MNKKGNLWVPESWGTFLGVSVRELALSMHSASSCCGYGPLPSPLAFRLPSPGKDRIKGSHKEAVSQSCPEGEGWAYHPGNHLGLGLGLKNWGSLLCSYLDAQGE